MCPSQATFSPPSRASSVYDMPNRATTTVDPGSDDPDAACVIEVQTSAGELLVSGVGETAADALASLFEHMLPPSSSEYIDPNDGMP